MFIAWLSLVAYRKALDCAILHTLGRELIMVQDNKKELLVVQEI